MTKQVIVLAISIVIALSGISQKTSDSTTLPNSQLKKAIIELETGKVVKMELDLTKNKVKILEDRIAIKDSIIAQHVKKDSLYSRVLWAYEGSIDNWKKILSNTEESYRYQLKLNKRHKITRWLSMLSGIGVGYFVFKK
jgi:hypothetical protein